MHDEDKKPVILRRWQLYTILAALATIAGLMVYDKAMAAEGDTEGAAVGTVGKPQPVEKQDVVPSKPDNLEDPGTIDELKSWLSKKKKEFLDDGGDIPMGSSGESAQKIPTETAVTLEQVFEHNADEVKQGVKRNAAFDAEQLDCVIRALFFEAGGEPELGIRWVYDVIKNRTEGEYRGNTTMCETIFDNKQFSFANMNPDRVPQYNEDLEQVTALAKEMYFDDHHRDMTCGATHYLVKDIMWDVKWSRQALQGNSDEGLVLKAVIGDHAFFGKEDC